MNKSIIILRSLCAIILIVISVLLYQSYVKHRIQIHMYEKAKALSVKLNKPLLVIGNPLESSTNYMFGSYGCGDICIDMNGCKCSEEVINISNLIENETSKFADNSVVIFESETLEYLDSDKIDYVISELKRISNNNIFSVHQLKPNSLWTKMKTNGYELFNKLLNKPIYRHNQLFYSCPPFADYKYKSAN